jgi:glycerol uptake facilitator-like aquaporin
MAYSLGIRCLAEFLGMMIVIYTGEAALANELLPSTKVCAGLTGITAASVTL